MIQSSLKFKIFTHLDSMRYFKLNIFDLYVLDSSLTECCIIVHNKVILYKTDSTYKIITKILDTMK